MFLRQRRTMPTTPRRTRAATTQSKAMSQACHRGSKLTIMSVIPRIFASSAWLLMGAFGITLRYRPGSGDEARGYSSLSIRISVVFIATVLVTMIFVKDRSSMEAAQGQKASRISLKEAIHVITANDQLKVYIGVVLAYNMLVQLAGGMAMYYFKYVTGDKSLFSLSPCWPLSSM